MKEKYIHLIVSFGAILFLVLTAFDSQATDENAKSNKDLINFSHSFHADIAECTDCHSKVPESTSLNDRLLPSHNDCGNCHDVNDDKNCKTCHKNEVYEPLIQDKTNMIFNHKDHLARGLECKDCHKDFTKINYSDEAEQKFPPMEKCASCHSPEGAGPNFCESCHISTAGLIPENHTTVDFKDKHKFLAEAANANCSMCHDNSTCEECHVATNTITETNTPDNFYQPYMPSQSIDGSKQQVISRVHEIGYRFNHGIDANLKMTDCQSCHQVETFCANCHQSEDADFSLGGVAPMSHLKADFTTMGVGSGGGEHAILARRDIESCAACHDVQGADPTCIKCHLDSDGIKNTDPKTHTVRFRRDDNGDWHENAGSICYNCHTSASPLSQKTDGFCNYCHTH